MFEREGTPLRQRLRQGGVPIGVFWFMLGSPALVEIADEAEPDAIVIDVQHGLWHRLTLEETIGTIGPRRPVLVRTADVNPFSIGQALDAGADGVLIPLVETQEQALQAVAAARFPPHGRRSGGGLRPLKGNFARYYERANEHTVVGVMIETALGVENAAEIAATPGIDFVLVGTGDLALSLGGSPEPQPEHERACRTVLEICSRAGMPCAIFTGNAESATARAREGYALTVVANDLHMITSASAGAMALFRKEIG